ncbi:Uncharacterised protein [uncultured archaeon]|nr:Uncharacterised protein [uncultured archaeon]
MAVVNPDDKSQVLNLKTLTSGTGAYSHDSYVYVQNDSVTTYSGDFEGSNRNITAKDDTSAVYSPVSFQFPGSFKAKTIKSLWKDQTCAKNYVGIISMNSLFDYARMLHKESTTIMYSDQKDFEGYADSTSSNIGSNMDINSKFDGAAHLGATINDVRGERLAMKDKSDNAVLMDEDYMGSFNITKKMAVALEVTTEYGDPDADNDGFNGNYPWLPCTCNVGWDDMTIHDQRYHSSKGFFDCTTCLLPEPCKN